MLNNESNYRLHISYGQITLSSVSGEGRETNHLAHKIVFEIDYISTRSKYLKEYINCSISYLVGTTYKSMRCGHVEPILEGSLNQCCNSYHTNRKRTSDQPLEAGTFG